LLSNCIFNPRAGSTSRLEDGGMGLDRLIARCRNDMLDDDGEILAKSLSAMSGLQKYARYSRAR